MKIKYKIRNKVRLTTYPTISYSFNSDCSWMDKDGLMVDNEYTILNSYKGKQGRMVRLQGYKFSHNIKYFEYID